MSSKSKGRLAALAFKKDYFVPFVAPFASFVVHVLNREFLE